MPATSSRYLCSELISVLYEDNSGQTRQLTANLEEISAQSAVLLLEQEIDLQSPVSMCIKGNDLYGCVDACTQDPVLGWFATLQLDRDSHWSGQRFVPEHFLPLGIPASLPNGEREETVSSKVYPLRSA